MTGLFDFILFLFEQEQDDILWEVWINKDTNKDYATYKKERTKSLRKTKIKKISDQDEQESIAMATRYIKPNNTTEKGGED